ncbi:MAG: DUF475 domain-containing protein [Alphaproteobacteria bacterium]|nr:DUF475 domain-containing protein [Alphaproteobacteria bacterium]
MKYFHLSNATTVLGLILAYLWAGTHGLMIAALLMIMEISLSFDNAVVNATVLRHMSEVWQRRFLTWGILIAVFGMRLIFPIVIVGFATGLSMWEVTQLALNKPEEYSKHVLDSHVQIAAFGGMFLLMVFLKFVLDASKDLHWIGWLEERLAKLGKLEAVEVVVAMTFLLVLQSFLPEHEQHAALLSGTIGVVLYVAISGLTALFSHEEDAADGVTRTVAYSGFMGFMYLQLLDASFSLDGVIGAFAISKDVIIIMLGLGIGAMFVRSLTIYMVRKGTLDAYVYLEHGAHWGIGALAAIMLISMLVHVSEFITGLIGLGFILLSLWSSVKYNRALKTSR